MPLLRYKKRYIIVMIAFIVVLLGWQFLTRLENNLLYNPTATLHPDVTITAVKDIRVRNKIQVLQFKSLDNTVLTAWYAPAQNGKSTILFAHGNGGNVTNNWDLLTSFVQEGYGYFALDYRGFGKSQGKPSEEGLYMDLKAASRLLANQYNVPLSSQVLMGGSLGGAVAIEVAQNIPYKAVVILCSFTSASDMGYLYLHRAKRDYLNWLPIPLLIRQPFSSITKIKNIRVPLLIIHSVNDTRIPFAMGQQLFKAATNSPYKRLYRDTFVGHSITTGVTSKQVIHFLNAISRR